MSFGERLRALRRERDLTQGTLATRTGMASSSISYLERRYTPPRQQTVQRLADALGVSEETLTGTRRDSIPLADLTTALFRQLPPPGTPWPVERQDAWLTTARATLRLLYGAADEEPSELG